MEQTPGQSATSSSKRSLSPSEMERRTAEAHELVSQHARWAMGAGLLPVPILDVAALTTINLRLLKKLAEHYEIPFSEHAGKSIVTSLLSSVFGAYIGRYLVYTVLKSIPVIGIAAGLASVPLAANGLTQAMGRLFIQHFETGGTLLSFNAKAMRKHFLEEFEASKAGATQVQQGNTQPSA